MNFDLSGKTALVTGSTQGIGYAAAEVLCQHGAQVFIHCSKDTDKARRIAAQLGAAGAVTADLGDADAAERLYRATGPLDIVVANASVQFRRAWQEIPLEEYDRQMNVNVRSTMLLMQKYIPEMQRRKWGRFVAVGSVQQYRPHPQMAVYAASKCAVKSLVENVAKQVAGDLVTVNMLLPGVIATPRNDEALSDEVYRAKVLAGIPAGYAGESTDCAGAILLLCSEEGRYITGTELIADGGMHL